MYKEEHESFRFLSMWLVICGVVCLLTLFVASCQSRISEGTISKLEHKEAHSQFMLLPITTTDGKSTTTIFTHYWLHYPDRWAVTIEAFQDDKWKSATYYVSQDVFAALEVGQMFQYDPDRDFDREPVTKEKEIEEEDLQ